MGRGLFALISRSQTDLGSGPDSFEQGITGVGDDVSVDVNTSNCNFYYYVARV